MPVCNLLNMYTKNCLLKDYANTGDNNKRPMILSNDNSIVTSSTNLWHELDSLQWSSVTWLSFNNTRLTALFPGLPRVSQYQIGKTNLDLLKQETESGRMTRSDRQWKLSDISGADYTGTVCHTRRPNNSVKAQTAMIDRLSKCLTSHSKLNRSFRDALRRQSLG